MKRSRDRKIRMPEHLVALIREMHPGLKKKVRAALGTVLSDPSAGKALQDDLAGLRSFRIRRLRIIYKTSGSAIQIVAIGPQIRVYEETSRLIRREMTGNKM